MSAPPSDHGKRWRVWSRFVIRSHRTNEPYLERLRIIETPWFGVYLHRILQPDPDLYEHDHPWNFVTFVLQGGYLEQANRRPVLVRWASRKRAEQSHRIIAVEDGTTTLVFRGRRRRDWGFYTRAGWIDWRTYLASINMGR